MCMSVPHIDVASIRTRMSRRPGLGMGHCSKTAPGPGEVFTTACIFSFNRFPRNWSDCRSNRVVKRYWRNDDRTVNASIDLGVNLPLQIVGEDLGRRLSSRLI